jgi:LacI family transcriptional regulator, galactose operon repressor
MLDVFCKTPDDRFYQNLHSTFGAMRESIKAGRARPTIADLATAADVSVATVDRVLNRRHKVRPATARRVLAAAEQLGYHATTLLRARLGDQGAGERGAGERGGACRMAFLLQKESNPFYRRLAADIEEAVAALGNGSSAKILFVGELDVTLILERMRECGEAADALAVVAVDHPRISEAVATLRARNVPVFALLSDLSAPERAGYIGLDARKAGRTAAWAIARMAARPGPIAIFVGSHRYLDHDTREISMRSYLRERAPDFSLLEPVVDLEQPEVAYDATLSLLQHCPGLVGIYTTGGGVDGVARALVERERRDVVLVCNELTPGARSGLIEGVVDLVIGTPSEALAEAAVGRMARAVADPAAPAAAAVVLLPFALYGPENI